MFDRNTMVVLLDYYGKLLSEKQYNTMVSYYYEDLSLNEIADNQGITKQAVSVSIKRAELKLMEFENELKMYKRNKELKEKLYNLAEKIISISDSNECDEFSKSIYSEIHKFAEEII